MEKEWSQVTRCHWVMEMTLQITWGTWDGTSTEIFFWALCSNWFYLINLTNLILDEPSSPVRIRNFMGKNALPLTLPFSLFDLSTPSYLGMPWLGTCRTQVLFFLVAYIPTGALITEDVVIFCIVLFDMRNPSGCCTQSLLIVHVVQLLGSMS